MKNVTKPSYDSWTYDFACPKCETEGTGEASDLHTGRFKTSGYFFMDNAVIEDLFYFECPTSYCGADVFVERDQIPDGLKLLVLKASAS